MHFDMRSKTVFVAGGTSGINLEIAKGFARAGAKIYVTSRNPDRIEAAVKELAEIAPKARGGQSDVRDYSSVEKVIEDCKSVFGLIDVVISGAAGNFIVNAEEMSANGFKTVIDIDLIGTFNVLRAAKPHLAKGASLINISATQSLLPAEGQAHVCAAKAGVNLLTQTLALEWGPEGIRVNAIAPGPIAGTEGMSRLTPTQEQEKVLTDRIPLRRYGEKSEIADACLFLTSPLATYITGVVLPVDGGQSLTGNTNYGSL